MKQSFSLENKAKRRAMSEFTNRNKVEGESRHTKDIGEGERI